ncbi:MAG: SurA N-terminal domain-containing protein [Halieaceae bacterium]|nr:SurA N-terminal domain-containing protein [Halieaceae bacterium]
MLQNIRQNIQGPTTKIVVWLIVISFSIFGIESILVGGGSGGVAEVNGEEIGPGELQQAVNNQKRRLIAMMGDNFDPTTLDDDLLGAEALEGLIDRKLLMQSAAELDLAASKREVGAMIANMEQFQIEGKFSPQLFTSVLANAGFTPAYFKETLRDDIALTQLRAGLMGSEFSTPLELSLEARVNAEQRDIAYLTIPLENFIADTPPGDEEIAAYYAANQEAFRSPETVELDYIELTPDDFRAPVDEAEVREAYRLETENTQYQTEYRVSHILFERGAQESEEALQQRVAQAQAALASGTAFADVAAQYSDDVGSAASGGDLGSTTGDAFPAEMEAVIASIEPGTVSDPVTTDAGVHLVLVTDRREGAAPDFEELRPQLEEQLQLSAARGELLLAVEELKDLVFNAENLDGPAQDMQLKVVRSEPVTRSQQQGLFAHPSLLAAAFSEEVLEDGHNSDVIELGEDRFVVLRVRQHNLPEVMPLERVRDEIAALITDQAARDQALAAAQDAMQALGDGATIEQVATQQGFPWQVEPGVARDNGNLPPEVLSAAFAMPVPGGEGAVIEQVTTPAGDVRIVSLSHVEPGSWEQLEQADQLAMRRQVSTELANLLNTEYQNGLRNRADIVVR